MLPESEMMMRKEFGVLGKHQICARWLWRRGRRFGSQSFCPRNPSWSTWSIKEGNQESPQISWNNGALVIAARNRRPQRGQERTLAKRSVCVSISTGWVPRLREWCRQSQAEEVSKSRNKIHQSWGPPFSRALYIESEPSPV